MPYRRIPTLRIIMADIRQSSTIRIYTTPVSGAGHTKFGRLSSKRDISKRRRATFIMSPSGVTSAAQNACRKKRQKRKRHKHCLLCDQIGNCITWDYRLGNAAALFSRPQFRHLSLVTSRRRPAMPGPLRRNLPCGNTIHFQSREWPSPTGCF